MSADDVEYTNDPEALAAKAKEHKEQFDEEHEALLEAAANDEELTVEETDTAEIGDATLTVKTSIPGKVMEKLDSFYKGETTPAESMETFADILTEQTISIEAEGYVWQKESDIRQFYRDFLGEYDVTEAGELAISRVIEEPCELEQDRREDVVRSFPSKGPRRGHRGTR